MFFIPVVFVFFIAIIVIIIASSSKSRKNKPNSNLPRKDNTSGHRHEFDPERIRRVNSQCPHCHTSFEPLNSHSFNSCPKCGEKLKNYCPTCGAINTSNAIMCQECNTPLASKKAKTKKKSQDEPLEW